MATTRPPAVAGSFYPDHPGVLGSVVAEFLAEAPAAAPTPWPKALIVPHAGFIYSGPIAASAYARLRPTAGRVRRVVLLGPSHYVPLRGLAAPRAAGFATPLGTVPVDRGAIAELADLPQVALADGPHAREHALEVQLPFLQALLGRFAIVPLVVGEAAPEEVAAVLERLWGGAETEVVISSDLSHDRPDAEARARDRATAAAIEGFAAERLTPEDACGCRAVAGLLVAAKARGLAIERLDLRNSGDTGGRRDHVVGYGAWAFGERV